MFQVNLLFALAIMVTVLPADASSLFEDDTVLPITLNGPLGAVMKDKKNREELDFTLGADGIEHQVKVRLRGKSRVRVCRFPGLRINFPKDKVAGTVFAGQNKLKLATHCADKKSARANVLEEYAAYRIFNLISDIGYRVRLVEVTYTDADKRAGENTFTRYGYLIESAQELAKRQGGEIMEVTSVRRGDFNSEHAALVFVFQYLIGNTDWSLVRNPEDEFCCHNGDIFDIGPDRYVVPYDFDLSGLVDAWYAKPDASLRIRSVTKRLYRGYCVAPGAVETALRDIAALESNILDTIRQVPGFTEEDIENALEYLGEFFEKTKNVGKLARSFENRCL